MIDDIVGPVHSRRRRAGRAEADAAAWELSRLAEEHAQLLLLLDRDSLCRQAADHVRRTTGTDFALVAPLEAEQEVVIRYLSGARGNALYNVAVSAGRGLGGRVLAYGRPAIVNDYGSDASITHDYDRPASAEGIRALAAVPILCHGRVAGVIYAGLRGDGSVGSRCITTMLGISKSMGLALQVQRQAAATTAGHLHHERQRTAAELHDSVGAMLFGIGAEVRNLRTECVSDPAILVRLANLEQRVSDASAALRQALSALRDVPEDDGLGMAVQCDCRAFQERTGIATKAIVLADGWNLRSGRQRVLRRVVREALLNVEKHARASSVVVSLAAIDNGVTLVVRDDGLGCGSDPDRGPGIGLASVAEELAHVGGTFGVVGDEDGGTTIRAWVPCL